jgi:hypothetical protein
MPHRSPAVDGTHDFLLVLVLGVVMLSQGVPPSPVMARPVLGRSSSPMPAEPSLAAANDHLTGDRSQPVGVTPKPVPFPDTSGDGACAEACLSQYDPRRDLRVALTDMMLQQRGFAGYPAAHFDPPSKGDVPASVLILAERSTARARPSLRSTQ